MKIKTEQFSGGIKKLSIGPVHVFWTPTHESRESAEQRLKNACKRAALETDTEE